MGSTRCNDCEVLSELHYDAEFQIWVRVEDDGTLVIGMTDIAQTIAGKILNVRVRKPGTVRAAGRPVATIESGKWAGPVPNPFDCVIAQANSAVIEEPGLLNLQPYAAWIAKVRPAGAVADALGSLVTGDQARLDFCGRVRRENLRCKRLALG